MIRGLATPVAMMGCKLHLKHLFATPDEVAYRALLDVYLFMVMHTIVALAF